MKSKEELEELEALKEELTALREQRAALTDEELVQVNGGEYYTREFWKKDKDVQFLFKVGDKVEVSAPFWFGTVHCEITALKTEFTSIHNTGIPGVAGSVSMEEGYTDYYYCQETEYHWHFPNGWYPRNSIEVRKLG